MTSIITISQLELTLTEIAGTIFSITGNDTFILTADNGQNFFVDLIDELNTSILSLRVGQSVRLTGFVNIEDNRLNLINTIDFLNYFFIVREISLFKNIYTYCF